MILMVGMIYFLISSTTGKAKNPNELISYLVLAVIFNIVYIYAIIQRVIRIKQKWIDDKITL